MITPITQTIEMDVDEVLMDSTIELIYSYKTSNKVDNKLRFEHVRVRPTIQRYLNLSLTIFTNLSIHIDNFF